MNAPLHLLMARDLGGAVGLRGGLPWTQRGDLKAFAQLTRGSVVLMGRATLESLPRPSGMPLPGRLLVTVSRAPVAWGHRALSPEAGLTLARQLSLERCGGTPVWLIGGAQLTAALAPQLVGAHLTLVQARAQADTFLPDLPLQLVETGPWQQGPRDEHPWRQEVWRAQPRTH